MDCEVAGENIVERFPQVSFDHLAGVQPNIVRDNSERFQKIRQLSRRNRGFPMTKRPPRAFLDTVEKSGEFCLR